MDLQNFIFSSSHQKVLKFLCEYMGKDFYDAEISRLIPDVSRASANNALRDLADWGITRRYFIGNIALNRIEPSTIFVREFRKFIYMTELANFVEEVRPWVEYMAIFGDYIEKPLSDKPIAELFIITDKPERVSRLLRQHRYSKHLTPIIYSPDQFEWFKSESPTIWREVKKGMRLI